MIAFTVPLVLMCAVCAPASSTDGPDKGRPVIVSRVATYARGNTTLELNSDGTAVVQFALGTEHGIYVLKGNELSVTVFHDFSAPFGRMATYRGKIRNGEIEFGDGSWVHLLMTGKLTKK